MLSLGGFAMPYAQSADAEIYYEATGQGPAVVFAHGAGGNRMSWWQQVPHFERTHRVVRIDHRGFGRSRCEPDAFHPKHFAADLLAVLDVEKIDRAALVCQSMGGWTGMRCALEHPDRVQSLTLCGTPGGVWTTQVAEAAAGLGRRIGEEGVQGNAALAPDFPKREPELAFLYDAINDLNQMLEPTLLGRLFDEEARFAPKRLEDFDLPTLFIAGESDQLFPPDALRSVASLIQGAEFVLLPVCGHSTYFEDAATFNRIVGEFIAKHLQA
jgi:pimeloyl-ACP methyl ester carboxylesterase